MIELLNYKKVFKQKKGKEIVIDYSHKAKTCGHVDGWNFLDKKKKVFGVIEKTENGKHLTKYQFGNNLELFNLHPKGEITLVEAEGGTFLGHIKDFKILDPEGQILVEYLKESKQIHRFWKKITGRLAYIDVIQLKGDIAEFNEIILFGIATFYYEIFM